VLIQRKSISVITPISIQCHVREYLGKGMYSYNRHCRNTR